MKLLELFLGYGTMFGLIVSRIGGFVAVSPFPGSHVPTQQRVGLVLVLSWVASSVAPRMPMSSLGWNLVAMAMTEVACGILIGLTWQMVFAAAEMLGAGLSHATGLSTPSVLNPSVDAHDTVFSRIVTLLALLLAVQTGVHRIAFGYVLESFRTLAPGATMDVPATLPYLIDWTGESLAVGLRLAMPVVAVNLVTQFALAMISRAAPSLQIFSVGFAVMITSGILMTMGSLDSMMNGMLSHMGTLGERMDHLIGRLGGGGP